jgi:hypothetical protein
MTLPRGANRAPPWGPRNSPLPLPPSPRAPVPRRSAVALIDGRITRRALIGTRGDFAVLGAISGDGWDGRGEEEGGKEKGQRDEVRK